MYSKRNKNFIFKCLSFIGFKLNRLLHEKFLFRILSREKVFVSIWRHNYWGSHESLSGPGSTLEQTENIRKNLPLMLDDLGIRSIFDAPCGDMHWMYHMLSRRNFTYIGGDIVSDLISDNNKKFSHSNIKFIKFDITSDDFPVADIWICRAIFYHFSNHDIYLALNKFANSNIKYILTTNCITGDDHINRDILSGDWRSLNLRLPPFNFPNESLWEVEDYVPPHPPMTLTLWSKDQIKELLPSIKKALER